jgi:hypothetical protein
MIFIENVEEINPIMSTFVSIFCKSTALMAPKYASLVFGVVKLSNKSEKLGENFLL